MRLIIWNKQTQGT